jgi:hypothetical protein
MGIDLKPGWEDCLPKKGPRVYPQGHRSKQQIDETFDELHKQGRMSWSFKNTPHAGPVFVVWKNTHIGEEKINDKALPDFYPIPLQSDMISAVQGSKYITVLDAKSFFYQWRVKPQDRHQLSVISHRGQEEFNVAVIGFKNSVSYVQRQIDTILRPQKAFARAYIDDVVVHSETLQEHCQHLREVLQVFKDVNISIKPEKSFVGFPSIRLLGQHIDT